MNRAASIFPVLLILTFTCHIASAESSGGFVLATHLGVAEGNFNLESDNSDADTGYFLDISLGYAFSNGFALTGGASTAGFDYEVSLLGESLEANFSLNMFDVSGWYFLPIGQKWELYGRLGLASTLGEFRLGNLIADDEGSGLVLALGVNWRLSKQVFLSVDLHQRYYGLAFNSGEEGVDTQDELTTTGLSVGIVWR
jgi:hypothetical protein